MKLTNCVNQNFQWGLIETIYLILTAYLQVHPTITSVPYMNMNQNASIEHTHNAIFEIKHFCFNVCRIFSLW